MTLKEKKTYLSSGELLKDIEEFNNEKNQLKYQLDILDQEYMEFLMKNKPFIKKLMPEVGSFYELKSVIEYKNQFYSHIKVASSRLDQRYFPNIKIDCFVVNDDLEVLDGQSDIVYHHVNLWDLGNKINLDTKGYVYLINVENTDIYKIGVTNNVEKRLYTLRTSNPFNLIVYKQYECSNPFEIERTLHITYKKKKVNGEWFKLSVEELITIDKCFAQ